jgi:hypothetical protein
MHPACEPLRRASSVATLGGGLSGCSLTRSVYIQLLVSALFNVPSWGRLGVSPGQTDLASALPDLVSVHLSLVQRSSRYDTHPSRADPKYRSPHSRKYVFSERATFAAANEIRRATYFATWGAIEPACIYRLRMLSLEATFLNSSFVRRASLLWQRLLFTYFNQRALFNQGVAEVRVGGSGRHRDG